MTGAGMAPNRMRGLAWGMFALILVAAPLIFHSGTSLTLLAQMGTMMILALSYNMLLGQGGMLSFGHAVYSGVGAFCSVHAMNLAGRGELWLPVTLVPLAGGVAGLLFGVVFGYVTTRKPGIAFSMITLGIVELVFAYSLMLPDFFGGEGGVSTNRVIGAPVFGISYGPQTQVVWLIAFWLFVSAAGMYAFTRTPLGRILNAVRDNPERAGFIGYDPRQVRYLALIISAFFAGIAGGLAAINFEMAGAESVSAVRSGTILIFTVIGGTGFFFGPMIGAVIGVFLTVMLSGLTPAWQLYLGMFFIAVVMYAPGGVAGMVMGFARVARCRVFAQVWPCLAALGVSVLAVFAGIVCCVEMLYRLTLDAANGNAMHLGGLTMDAHSASVWLVVAVPLAAGTFGIARTFTPFLSAWQAAHAAIDARAVEEHA